MLKNCEAEEKCAKSETDEGAGGVREKENGENPNL